MKKPTPKCSIFMGKNPKNFWAPSPDPTPGSEGGHPSETTTITGYSTKSKQKNFFRADARWMLWYRRAHTSFRSKRTLCCKNDEQRHRKHSRSQQLTTISNCLWLLFTTTSSLARHAKRQLRRSDGGSKSTISRLFHCVNTETDGDGQKPAASGYKSRSWD